MQEKESSRNGDPQEDRNWQEQGEKNGKGVDGGKVKGMGQGMDERNMRGETWRGEEEHMWERSGKERDASQLGLAVMGTWEE